MVNEQTIITSGGSMPLVTPVANKLEVDLISRFPISLRFRVPVTIYSKLWNMNFVEDIPSYLQLWLFTRLVVLKRWNSRCGRFDSNGSQGLPHCASARCNQLFCFYLIKIKATLEPDSNNQIRGRNCDLCFALINRPVTTHFAVNFIKSAVRKTNDVVFPENKPIFFLNSDHEE